jgi:hypothetical protein
LCHYTTVRLTAGAKPGKCDVAMDAQIGVNTPVVGPLYNLNPLDSYSSLKAPGFNP